MDGCTEGYGCVSGSSGNYPELRMRKLIGLGVASHYAATIANDRKGYWFNAGNKAVNWALNKERLISWGYYDLATAYQSMHVNY